MEELLEALNDAKNVKSIIYDKCFGKWVITYLYDIPERVCEYDEIISFLENNC